MYFSFLSRYSIPLAKARIARLKSESELSEATRMARDQDVQRKVKTLDILASQISDTRPISWCHFSPDSKMLATGSWSGLCKVRISFSLLITLPSLYLCSKRN